MHLNFISGVSQQFDPLKQTASKGTAPPLEKPEETPEDLIKQMEKKVNRLIEDSVVAAGDGNYQLVSSSLLMHISVYL